MFKTIALDPERRVEIAKMLGRMFLILLPVIGMITAVAFIWTFRRRAIALEGPVVESLDEPTYEAAEPLPA